MARAVSVIGLALVWVLIWANLPSKDEWFSAQVKPALAAPATIPQLDLTIPGVSPQPSLRPSAQTAAPETAARMPFGDRADLRLRQITEFKCDAEVQQACPESLAAKPRRRCVASRLNTLTPACQDVVRQRIVRWKDADGSPSHVRTRSHSAAAP